MLQPNLTFQIGLGIVINVKHDGGLVTLKREALSRGECLCALERGAWRHFEVDGGFGKSAEEIAVSDERAEERG